MRTYDPGTGQYTQVDPLGFVAGDVNLYQYVGNLPVRWIDPEGLEAFCTPYLPTSETETYILKRGNLIKRKSAGVEVFKILLSVLNVSKTASDILTMVAGSADVYIVTQIVEGYERRQYERYCFDVDVCGDTSSFYLEKKWLSDGNETWEIFIDMYPGSPFNNEDDYDWM